MKEHTPTGAILRAEIFLMPSEGHLSVDYHWSDFDYKNPPPDRLTDDCFLHGQQARTALLELAATAWNCHVADLILSSPVLEPRPSGNAYGVQVRWAVVGPHREHWQGVQVHVTFVDPYLLATLAPHRFDVFFTPWSAHPMVADDYDSSDIAARMVTEWSERSKSALAELVGIAYQRHIASVELGAPRWEKETVTYDGGDAFRITGVVRAASDQSDGAGAEPAWARAQVGVFRIPGGAFPDDVTYAINSTIAEAVTCFHADCHLASIALCGRAIETLLSAAYKQFHGGDADAERLGYHAIRRRLRDRGFLLDEAIDSQIDLINAHRNKAVHGSVRVPTRDEALAVLLFTRDATARIVAFINAPR